MPYIPENRRTTLKLFSSCCNCGELNYVITDLIHDYIKYKGLSYATLNEVIGVLECSKLELYRMVVAPYENNKQKVNGSISDLD